MLRAQHSFLLPPPPKKKFFFSSFFFKGAFWCWEEQEGDSFDFLSLLNKANISLSLSYFFSFFFCQIVKRGWEARALLLPASLPRMDGYGESGKISLWDDWTIRTPKRERERKVFFFWVWNRRRPYLSSPSSVKSGCFHVGKNVKLKGLYVQKKGGKKLFARSSSRKKWSPSPKWTFSRCDPKKKKKSDVKMTSKIAGGCRKYFWRPRFWVGASHVCSIQAT